MTTKPDYYSIIQVHPRAEKEVIDAAYRKLAAKYHPDVNHLSDADEKMKRLNVAYQVLSDPVKRATYDASLALPLPPKKSTVTAVKPEDSNKLWRTLLIGTAVVLFVFLLPRLGPSLLVFAPRVLVPLLVIWLILKLVKRGQ